MRASLASLVRHLSCRNLRPPSRPFHLPDLWGPSTQARIHTSPLQYSASTQRQQCIEALRLNPELNDEEDARLEYGWIVAHVKENDVPDQAGLIYELCRQRGSGQPLQYVLGDVDFGGLRLRTRAPIFIPRPETADVMDHLADLILNSPISSSLTDNPLRILDICTGSGSLALILAHRFRSKAQITGIDINPDAIALAKENAVLNDLATHIDFTVRDFITMDSMATTFDIVVSNPPYIPRSEWETLPSSVKDHEDPRALVGDPQDLPATSNAHQIPESSDGQGLYFYRRIAKLLPTLCQSSRMTSQSGSPIVAVECGASQADEVRNIFENQSNGLVCSTCTVKDQFGRDRMVIGMA